MDLLVQQFAKPKFYSGRVGEFSKGTQIGVKDSVAQTLMWEPPSAVRRAELDSSWLAALEHLCETCRVLEGFRMRLLNIVTGLAVLFATLAFGHLLYHFSTHAGTDDFHN